MADGVATLGTAPARVVEPPSRSASWDALRRLLRHRSFQIGLFLFAIILVAAIFAPLITASDPNKLAMRARFKPPSLDHWFGTDNFGRSQLARVVYGAQLSLFIGTAVVVINAVFGTLLGAISGTSTTC